MKFILWIVLSVYSFSFIVKNSITIAHQAYVIIHESYDEYSDKGIEMKLYKKGQSLESLPLFSCTLENQSGGCGEHSTQDGTYEINGTTLTLYTHWDRTRRAYNAAKGDRIQHYHIDTQGHVNFIDGMLYIETQSKHYDKHSAVKFLSQNPATLEEIQRLATYKKDVETQFKGRFVTQAQRIALHKRVEEALLRKKKTRWQ